MPRANLLLGAHRGFGVPPSSRPLTVGALPKLEHVAMQVIPSSILLWVLRALPDAADACRPVDAGSGVGNTSGGVLVELSSSI